MKVMDKHRNPKALKAVRDAANGRAQGDKPAQATKDSLPGSWAMSNRKKLLSKVNEAEELLAAVLTRCGLVFTREHVVRCNGNVYYIDFAAEVEGVGIVGIEVDGSQHFTAKGQASDRRRERDLIRSGEVVSILRLSWSTVKGITPGHLMEAVRSIPHEGVLLMY